MMILRTIAMVIVAQAFLLATSVGSAPPCVPDTLAAYMLLVPAQGCTIAGNVKVMNFTFSVVGFSGVPLNASQIFVTPVVGPFPRYALNFSAAFSVTGSEFETYEVRYIFDPSDIRSLEDVMTAFSPVAPGQAIVDTFGCLGSGYIPNCPGTEVHLTVLHDGITFTPLDQNPIFPLQSILGIRNVIDLQANGASADFTSIENAVYLPEPATWIMVFAGSVVLALRRRLR